MLVRSSLTIAGDGHSASSSWLHRVLYGTEIQDWFSPPFGVVVVDGLNAGQLHHAVKYPLREHA